jgi:hypothetical protein
MGSPKSPDDKPNPDATMMVTESMLLPLGAATADQTMPVTPDMVMRAETAANATMLLTPDMIVNDASLVMGRAVIERALAVVGLWHAAVNTGDVDTVVATCADDVELIGPRGSTKGLASLRDWLGRAGFSALPRRWFCGGDGNVVVEEQAKWRDRDGEVGGVIAAAFVVRSGRITRFERFDELATALTMYGLREVHQVTRRR